MFKHKTLLLFCPKTRHCRCYQTRHAIVQEQYLLLSSLLLFKNTRHGSRCSKPIHCFCSLQNQDTVVLQWKAVLLWFNKKTLFLLKNKTLLLFRKNHRRRHRCRCCCSTNKSVPVFLLTSRTRWFLSRIKTLFLFKVLLAIGEIRCNPIHFEWTIIYDTIRYDTNVQQCKTIRYDAMSRQYAMIAYTQVYLPGPVFFWAPNNNLANLVIYVFIYIYIYIFLYYFNKENK